MWKNKWTAAFTFWLVFTIVMVAVMPNLDKLVLEKGQITLPETSMNEKGNELLQQFNDQTEGSYQFVLVFHNESTLSVDQTNEIFNRLEEITAKADQYGINDYLFPTDSEEAKKQLVSEDGTTILAQLAVSHSVGPVEDVIKTIEPLLEGLSMETFLTGSDVILSDFAMSSQEGIKKTEVIAVIVILIILIVIFRSPVIPVISLLTVGVSYLTSLSLIALLVEHFNLPFSNFTQVFLVVVLFGVGTDYNILLYSRFKEELVKQQNTIKAISTTYQTAGKTVLYSGLAVLVGFASLSFTQFSIYKATSPVAIGVAILLLVLYTLNPFFMSVFGMKTFWPIKKINSHTDNKMWAVFSRFAFMRPIIALMLLALIFTPIILNYKNELNYNDLTEIDDKYESKQGVAIIEEHYAPGFSSPITLTVKSDKPITTQQILAELDELSETILQVPGVEQVYGVTRPNGERIEELYVSNQSDTLQSGLSDAQSGVDQIQTGLAEVVEEVDKPQDLSGAQQLVDATKELSDGSIALQKALSELTSGLTSGEQGAAELTQQLNNLHTAIKDLSTGVAALNNHYELLSTGFAQYTQLFMTLQDSIATSTQGYEQIEQLMQTLVANNPEMATNSQVQMTIGIAQQAKTQLTTLQAELKNYSAEYEKLVAGISTANSALIEVEAGLQQVEQGTGQLALGANELHTGLNLAADGSNEITSKSEQFVSGLNLLHTGQSQMQVSLQQLQSEMERLGEGLGQSTEGLLEIYNGLTSATAYLQDLSTNGERAFFIPNEVLTSDEFAESLSIYSNSDTTMARWNIILSVNPFTEDAMEIGKQIVEKVEQFEATSTISNIEVGLAGKTIQNIDLQSISQEDFIRSLVVMMLGILIILLVVTKSVPQSLAIIITLVIATFSALSITQYVTTQWIGHEMLSWNVPFFSMITIIAIGVDYSIFFIMRYNESKEEGLKEILVAAAQMGGVVLSAAVILGATFAALIPSGIMTLIQVAITVVIGLMLLSCILMPLFIPALFGFVQKVKGWNNKESDV